MQKTISLDFPDPNNDTSVNSLQSWDGVSLITDCNSQGWSDLHFVHKERACLTQTSKVENNSTYQQLLTSRDRSVVFEQLGPILYIECEPHVLQCRSYSTSRFITVESCERHISRKLVHTSATSFPHARWRIPHARLKKHCNKGMRMKMVEEFTG